MGLTGEELERFVVEDLKQSRFRAGQIGGWLARGADIPEMTNLSAALKQQAMGLYSDVIRFRAAVLAE